MSDERFEYDSVCKDLDKLAVAILSTLEAIILERQDLDAKLKEGYIDMAKSRYLMRGQKVSILQINSNNLIATRKIFSCSDIAGNTEYLNYATSDRSEFGKLESGLKNRLGVENDLVKKMKNVTIDGNSECKSAKEFEVPASSDPLKWFGVLVPESLRSCQLRFQQVTDTSLRIASLQNKLKALGVEYRILRLKKEALCNSSKSN